MDKLFDGKKPPDDIIVIDKFKELNNLISKRLNITNIESDIQAKKYEDMGVQVADLLI